MYLESVKLTRYLIFVLSLLAVLAACAPERVEEPFEPSASHHDYLRALERLDLDETAMGGRWIAAAREAFAAPAIVETPFEEIVLLDPESPSVIAYQFAVDRGRAVTVTISTDVERYFADLFRVDAESGPADSPGGESNGGVVPAGFTLVASRPEGGNEIRFEPRRDGVYLLRIQPELLRGGRYTIRIESRASLAFPVEEAGPGSIWSFYGDGRDGGARRHEGVDIFAPRGTPVLAVSDSIVIRVGVRDRGGNVVTLHDEKRDLLLYYAHLEEQLVERGERVFAGDVIGTVGNTGNAITTPPHLHIGVYQGSWREDVDPWNYFVDPPLVDAPEPSHGDLVGGWVSVRSEGELDRFVRAPAAVPRWVNRNPLLRREGAGDSRSARGDAQVVADAANTSDGEVESPPRLPVGAAVQVVGASGGLIRVRTADGSFGFVDPAHVSASTGEVAVRSPRTMYDLETGDAFAEVTEGERVMLLGRVSQGTIVMRSGGRVGLIRGTL